MVETGVLHGASSAHILHALAENGEGHLHSIDLPKDDGDPPQDFLVPPAARDRWTLVLGDAREELSRVLEELRKVDLFHHHSLHTFDHMLFEYDHLLTSHDVVNPPLGRNAFTVFCKRHGLPNTIFRNVGIARCKNGSVDGTDRH